jgi:MHS family proline/betaine transporter-like MFS transporter
MLVIIRLLQGLSLGGGFSGCIAFTIEHAPDNKRGLAGSASIFSMCAGILIGLGIAILLSHSLPEKDFETWGWRIPFIISIFIGFIGLYIKNHLHESPVYLQAKKEGHLSATPMKEVLTTYLPEVMTAVGIYLTVTVPFYTLMIFMNSYMTQILGRPIKEALLMNTISILVHMAFLPFASALSDKIGRKPILVASSLSFLVLTYPIFLSLAQPGIIVPLLGQVVFGIILAFYMSPVPAILVELFPTSVRFSGIAVSYNLSAAIFGGSTPAVALWLIKSTQMNHALAFYIMLFAGLSLISLYYFRDKFNQPLA